MITAPKIEDRKEQPYVGIRIENYLTDPAKEPDSAKWETELAFKLADDQRGGLKIEESWS